MPAIGARIPIVVGSFGADAIYQFAHGETVPEDPLIAKLPRLVDAGVSAVEEYVAWNVVEPAEGRFDFARAVRHRDAARRAGLSYLLYPWLHALPSWMQDASRFTPFRCLEHQRDTGYPSIFAPRTLELFDRFFERVAAELGSAIDQVTLALPCDYGEYGYPTGMGAWIQRFPPSLDHHHVGFWCGDEDARAAFRTAMLARHGAASRINDAWGTAFASDADVAPPVDLAAPRLSDDARRDVLEWYRHALVGFFDRLVDVAEARFPNVPLAVKCGYAGEAGPYGQDYVGLARVAKRRDVALWNTHGTLPVIHQKRFKTICRVIGVPYGTEGITERTPRELRRRIFDDASDGATSFFEFHQTFDVCRDVFDRYAHHLRGEEAQVDVSLLFNSTQQVRHPAQSLPARLYALGEPLRDLLDFDVVDEDLLEHDAALATRGVLVIPDVGPLRERSIDAIATFAERGGLVVLPAGASDGAGDGLSLSARLGGANRGYAPSADLLEFRGAPRSHQRLRFGHEDEWWLAGRDEGPEAAAHFFGDAQKDSSRWIGGEAVIRLPVDPNVRWTLSLELFADPRARPDEWTLSTNGESTILGRPGARTVDVDLDPDRLAGREVIEVRLRGPTFRPADDGASPDQRRLGLVLRRATLLRVGEDETIPARPRPHWMPVRADPDVLRERSLVRLGRGGLLLVPPHDLPALAAVTFAASAHRSRILADAVDFPQPAGDLDGVRATILPARILLHNRTARHVTKRLRIPDGTTRDVPVPAGEIVDLGYR